MVKITEKNDKKEQKFFKIQDIVGQPFVIMENLNANSDFREVEKKTNKDGKLSEGNYVRIMIMVESEGETKDVHMTMSALRSLRDSLPNAISTWKGQRVVINSLAKDYSPTKFTRLGAITTEQMNLIPPAPPTDDDILKPIISKLKFGESFFPEGLIPLNNVVEACITPANFQKLKDTGRIYEPKTGFFKVV